MEAQEEFMGSSNDLTQIVKGKRTKRQRSSSPYKSVMTTTSSSSSGCCGGGGDGGGDIDHHHHHRDDVVVEEYGTISSPTTTTTTSSEVYHDQSTEEEEDMANCLILLAQGDGRPSPIIEPNFSDLSAVAAVATTTTNKAGFYVYECKTCNRSFPSFQALGGHRASHKKPKAEEKKPIMVLSSIDQDIINMEDCQLNKSSSPLVDLPLSIHVGSTSSSNNKGNFLGNKAKIHECTICGSQFTSGQALGGHMRRHRPITDNNQAGALSIDCTIDHDHHHRSSNVHGSKFIKPRNILSLDLNLPAPEDDHLHRESQFQFVSTQQGLVFTAPALVDCHY